MKTKSHLRVKKVHAPKKMHDTVHLPYVKADEKVEIGWEEFKSSTGLYSIKGQVRCHDTNFLEKGKHPVISHMSVQVLLCFVL